MARLHLYPDKPVTVTPMFTVLIASTQAQAPLWTAWNSLAAIECTALKTRNHGPTAGKPHAPARWRSLCPAGILEQADDRIVIVHSVIAELREALR